METERKRRARIPFTEKLQRVDETIARCAETLEKLKAHRALMIKAHREKAEAMLGETGGL